MRRGEGDVAEERLVRVLLRVLAQEADRVIGDRDGRIPRLVRFRQRHVIQFMPLRLKVAVLLRHVIRMIKTTIRMHARRVADMPLAALVAAVAQLAQTIRQHLHPRGEFTILRVHADLLRIISRHQRAACRPATRRVVELREAQPARRQLVEIRRRDLAAVTSEVRPAEVIDEDEHKVRLRMQRGGKQQGDEQAEDVFHEAEKYVVHALACREHSEHAEA